MLTGDKAVIGAAGSKKRIFLYYTMTSQEPQPCVEGVSLSGAMARLGGGLHHEKPLLGCALHGVTLGVSPTIQGRVARSATVCEQVEQFGDYTEKFRIITS